MKYLKILGLAAVAATALMAFVGAGTASAETTLCTATETPCSTNHPPLGTTLSAEGIAGEGVTKPTLTAPFGNITCSSTISGPISTTTTPEGSVTVANLSWTGCVGGTAETKTGGTIKIHHDAEHNGVVTLAGFVVKVTQAGIPCWYESKTAAGGPLEGTFTGGTVGGTAIIHLTAEPVVISNATHPSSGFCPTKAPWHATYKVTAPAGKSLFVSTT